MPKFLGIDFLSQALGQKEQLLSHLLISCPGYGEAENIFQVASKNDRNFSWYLFKAQYEKVPNKDAGSYLLEIIPSRFTRKLERYCYSHEIEYVPSSNPDSPPPSFLSDSFCELEEEIVKDVCDYLRRHEIDFTKHDQPYSFKSEGWSLEEIVLKESFEEFLRRIPRFQDLLARLKRRKVADPFIGNDGCLRSEHQTICSKFHSEENVTNTCNVGIPSKEVFVKLSVLEQCETEQYNFASPLIGSAYSLNDTCFNITCKNASPIPEQNSEVILECNNYLQVFSLDELHTSSCKTVRWTEHQKYVPAIKCNEEPKVMSFLEINQTESANAVKDVSLLVLESPPPTYSMEDHSKSNLDKHNFNNVTKCHVQLGEPLCIFSPRSHKKIIREVVASSRVPDKVSSLMLVVPYVDDEDVMLHNVAYEISTLPKEDFHSELELQLHWDPLDKKKMREDINQVRFTVNKECSSPDSPIEIPNIALMLQTKWTKIQWKNVYVSCTDVSPMQALEPTKEVKPSPLMSRVTIEKENSESREINISTSGPGNTAKHGGVKTPKALDGSKMCANIYSGIDDFVLLRTGVKSSRSSSFPPKAIVKAMKVDQRTVDQNKDSLMKVEDLKDHVDVVEVYLTSDLQTAHSYIESHIRPCLVQLQEIGCVAPSYTSTNLTGDYTRFVLKQEEKKNADLFNTDQTCNRKKYKMLICLHILVTTAELIRECGITVAQDHIKTMSTQYTKELAGALDQITNNLMKIEQSLANSKTSHPKVVATYNYVRAWQPQPSPSSLDEKILVMIFRGFREVSTCLANIFQRQRSLKTTTVERNTPLFPLLNNAHVVICDPANVPDNFPWSSFPSFIAYEDKTEWLSKMLLGKSVKVNNFICLKGSSSRDAQEHTQVTGKEMPVLNLETPKLEIYTLIGSSKITKNASLLMCLEQRCGIIIIEREYEKILKRAVTTSSKMCRQPDLILDQRAGVIVDNVLNFASEDGYKNIVDLVLSTSFKCEMCSIILVCEKNRNSVYPFSGDVQSNLAKFHGCLMSIHSSFPHFVADVFYSQSMEHTASLIRRICDITRDSSNVFTKQDWLRRKWLSEECSQHEKFLLGFPSLNSFSAQLMLNVLPLNMLLTAPLESLRKALPWIPDNILKNFKETTECGLHEQEDETYPIQIPHFPDNDTTEPDHNEYHFGGPVIDNTIDDCSFSRVEMSSKYSNPNSPHSFARFPQYQDHDFFIAPCTTSREDISEETTQKHFAQHQTMISDNYFGNSNTFTETPLDRSFNNSVDSCFDERWSQRRVRSPVRSKSVEEAVGRNSSTRVGNNHHHSVRNNRGKTTLLTRPAKSLKRGHEMPDVVGVVQPKPRDMPMSAELRTPAASYLSQATATVRNNVARHTQTIPSYQYPKQNQIGTNSECFLSHAIYEKPQKKKKKLTYEIVPGAKNGQTRLTFV